MAVYKFRNFEDADKALQTTGKAKGHRKGFTEELNKFFKLVSEFKSDRTFLPRGVFRFKDFEEANEWRHKMLRRTSPGRRQ